MSVWLTHMLLKNRRVYSQLNLRMSLPQTISMSNGAQSYLTSMECLSSKTSGFLSHSSADVHHGSHSHLAYWKQPSLITCSSQLLIIYRWAIGHQEHPACHPARWTPGLLPLPLSWPWVEMEGKIITGLRATCPQFFLCLFISVG